MAYLILRVEVFVGFYNENYSFSNICSQTCQYSWADLWAFKMLKTSVALESK